MQYHNLVWIGNKQFPNIIDFIHIELYGCQCLFQIQAAAILTGFSLYLLVNFQVTQWHIVPCVGCYALHFFKGNGFCCLNVFFCEEFADFQKSFIGIWVVAFSSSAWPDGIFVQFDNFVFWIAEQHAPDSAVPDWQCMVKICRWTAIPKCGLWIHVSYPPFPRFPYKNLSISAQYPIYYTIITHKKQLVLSKSNEKI